MSSSQNYYTLTLISNFPAANDLDSLVLDIKKNPKKYLRIQIC